MRHSWWEFGMALEQQLDLGNRQVGCLDGGEQYVIIML
jgi:hypothetical protein